MSEEKKMILTDEMKRALSGLTVIDPEKEREYYPIEDKCLENLGIPKEFYPVFLCKVLNKTDQIRLSTLQAKIHFLSVDEIKEMLGIISNYVVGWKNIINDPSDGFLEFTKENFEKITYLEQLKIGNYLSKISGLTKPEKLSLR